MNLKTNMDNEEENLLLWASEEVTRRSPKREMPRSMQPQACSAHSRRRQPVLEIGNRKTGL